METRQSALVESIVGLLVPPAAREHVLGDLRQRHVSNHGYLLEAARVVPFVIFSQARRTSDPLLLATQAYALFLVFRPQRFAYDSVGFAQLAMPIVAALLVLVLCDAFQRPRSPAPEDVDVVFNRAMGRAVVAACLAMLAAGLSQAALGLLNAGDAWRLARPGHAAAGGFLMLLEIRVAWEMMFRANLYQRVAMGSVRRDAVSPEVWRRALERRRDILRRSWLWFLAPLVLANFAFLAFARGQRLWPLMVEASLTAAALGLLRQLTNRLAGLLQRDLDRESRK